MESPAATLRIDLAALKRNYLELAQRAVGARCAAAVKADAYGLGIAHVGPALWDAGCRAFFVAHAAEGTALRGVLPQAEIYVLHGLANGPAAALFPHNLRPVLNSLDEVDRWTRDGGKRPAAIHVDTGINRLGLSDHEIGALLAAPERAGFPVAFLMSHLACADEPSHALNRIQRDRFAAYGAAFRQALGRPDLPLSLANSAGVLLGPDYHFDLVRPGIALYGGNPLVDAPNPMRSVVTLSGNILQIREVRPPAAVGYGAAYRPTAPCRIATVDVGYADGFLRAFGEGAHKAEVGGYRAPVVGRISMDMLALDVTGIPHDRARPGAQVTLLGDAVTLDEASRVSGFSAYELLTLLGHRYNRVYVDDRQAAGRKVLISE